MTFATQRAEDAAHKYPLTKTMREDPLKRGVPLFLQTQNRRPLTPAQQAAWDERTRAAAAVASRSDFRKPKSMTWEEFDAIEAARAAEKKAASYARIEQLRARRGAARDAVAAPRAPRTRRPALTGSIRVLAKACPYRAGSAGAAVFALYADGATVDDFMRRAEGHTGRRRPADFIAYDVRRGYIVIEEKKS